MVNGLSSTGSSSRVNPVSPITEDSSGAQLHRHDIPDSHAAFVCLQCSTTLALVDELVSRAFSGREGKAFLLNSTINTIQAPAEERVLLTGAHTVADISCATCAAKVGWKYLKATQEAQKYKEGKSILESARVVKENGWSLS